MKQFLPFILLSFTCLAAYSQAPEVPYRLGDKFGLSDANGRMRIPAQYDIIDVVPDSKNFFIAYTLKDGKALSSLIYNDKVILRDKAYRSYRLTGNVIKASVYSPGGKPKSRNRGGLWDAGANIKTVEHLYGTDGNRILDGDYEDLYVSEKIDGDPMRDELLITATDTNGLLSLLVYNMKKKKITKTFFSGSKVMEVEFGEEYERDKKWQRYLYEDAGRVKTITLAVVNKKLTATEPESATLPARNPYEDRRTAMGGFDVAPVMPGPYDAPPSPGNVIPDITQIKVALDFYYAPKKAEHIIELKNKKLDSKGPHIVLSEGKKGMKAGTIDTFLVPPKYDDIFQGDFTGGNGGYVLKTGDKYGLYIYRYPNNITIEPVFDKRPLLLALDYFGRNTVLIKLYDEKGDFFCYAGGDGKLFYTAR